METHSTRSTPVTEAEAIPQPLVSSAAKDRVAAVESTWAVRLLPSPAVLRLTFAAGVCEVSRFSCMKFLGVPGVFDYAGLNRNSRYRPRSCCLPRITKTSASGLHLFGAEYPPRLYLCLRFAGSLAVAAQDSRPSGSLVLTRKASSSSASCRFSPAHCNRDVSSIDNPPARPPFSVVVR